jgi:thioredoxin-like negative regulator of GroEL
MNRIAVAQKLVKLAKELTAADTFPCPDCGTKVLEKTGYCVKCKKKVKAASRRQASTSLLNFALPEKEMRKLEHHVDEQTWDLAVEVYQKLQEKFRLNNDEQEALNRLIGSVRESTSFETDIHRNNIFKAAHALGIKLPSGIF